VMDLPVRHDDPAPGIAFDKEIGHAVFRARAGSGGTT
jgi:hypothetical protein